MPRSESDKQQRRRQPAGDHCRNEITINRRQIQSELKRHAPGTCAEADSQRAVRNQISCQKGPVLRRSCNSLPARPQGARAVRTSEPTRSFSPWLNMSSLVGAFTSKATRSTGAIASSTRPTAARHVRAPVKSKTSPPRIIPNIAVR